MPRTAGIASVLVLSLKFFLVSRLICLSSGNTTTSQFVPLGTFEFPTFWRFQHGMVYCWGTEHLSLSLGGRCASHAFLQYIFQCRGSIALLLLELCMSVTCNFDLQLINSGLQTLISSLGLWIPEALLHTLSELTCWHVTTTCLYLNGG